MEKELPRVEAQLYGIHWRCKRTFAQGPQAVRGQPVPSTASAAYRGRSLRPLRVKRGAGDAGCTAVSRAFAPRQERNKSDPTGPAPVGQIKQLAPSVAHVCPASRRKIFRFYIIRNRRICRLVPFPLRGALRDRHDVGSGAVDADQAVLDEQRGRVRRSRVVLTSRR